MPALPRVLAGPVSRAAETLRAALGGLAWGPALAVAKPAILSVFSRIEAGTLLLVDEPGETRHVFGQKLFINSDQLPLTADVGLPRRADAAPKVEIVVKNDAFWMRVLLFADMGFAESFMLGDFECEDLTSFFRVGESEEECEVPVRQT